MCCCFTPFPSCLSPYKPFPGAEYQTGRLCQVGISLCFRAPNPTKASVTKTCRIAIPMNQNDGAGGILFAIPAKIACPLFRILCFSLLGCCPFDFMFFFFLSGRNRRTYAAVLTDLNAYRMRGLLALPNRLQICLMNTGCC